MSTSDPACCNLLFVYGTLRRASSSPMHNLLAAWAQPLGEARVRGKLYKLDWYPGAVKSADESEQIIGEVFRLKTPDSVLRQLDHYEGVGPEFPQSNEYVREISDVVLKDGRRVQAWVYWFTRPTDGLERIKSGDFLASQQ